MTRFQKTNRGRTRRRGATIVEFAYLLPVLLAILLGILESGWMVKNYLTLANATRDGARAAAVGRSTSGVETRIINLAKPLTVVSPNGNIVREYSIDDGVTYYAWPGDSAAGNNGVPAGRLLRITCTAKHRSLTGFFGPLASPTLKIVVAMRREP